MNTYQVEVRISESEWGLVSAQSLDFNGLMELVEQYNIGLPNEAYLHISLEGISIPVEDFYPHLIENQQCLNCMRPIPHCEC